MKGTCSTSLVTVKGTIIKERYEAEEPGEGERMKSDFASSPWPRKLTVKSSVEQVTNLPESQFGFGSVWLIHSFTVFVLCPRVICACGSHVDPRALKETQLLFNVNFVQKPVRLDYYSLQIP